MQKVNNINFNDRGGCGWWLEDGGRVVYAKVHE